jgi:hypothetical protein
VDTAHIEQNSETKINQLIGEVQSTIVSDEAPSSITIAQQQQGSCIFQQYMDVCRRG